MGPEFLKKAICNQERKENFISLSAIYQALVMVQLLTIPNFGLNPIWIH